MPATAKPARTLKVVSPLADLIYAVVTEGRATDTYRIDAGYRCVRWVHTGDGERGGIVTLNGAGRATECDCRGWRRWGKCRHAAGTEVMVRGNLVTLGVVEECREAMADDGRDVSDTERE